MRALAAVVFDVDGTLVDSERDGHRVAFNAAFEEAGLPDRWDEVTYGGLLAVAGGAQRLEYWFSQQGHPPDEARELARRLHPRKTEIMRELVIAGRIQPRAGAVELLDLLAQRGLALHVATTGTRAWVEPLLAHAFGPERFDSITTGTEVPELKPSPAVYLDVLSRTGLSTASAVAVEDSANGVRAALGAGLPCVVTTNDYTRDHDLAGAEIITSGLDDPALLAWFDRR